jgi:hypothetical protein
MVCATFTYPTTDEDLARIVEPGALPTGEIGNMKKCKEKGFSGGGKMQASFTFLQILRNVWIDDWKSKVYGADFLMASGLTLIGDGLGTVKPVTIKI